MSILCKNHIIPQKRVRHFFCEIFKIDEKEKLNQDEKFKEEVVNMFLDIFFGSGVTYQSLANGSVFHSGFPTKKVLLTNFADNSKMNNTEK